MTYILEGEVIVNVDGKETRVGAGGMSFVPKGVPHAFLVVSDSARLLSLHSPGHDEPGVLPRRQRAGDRRHLRHGRHRTPPGVRESEPSRHRNPRPASVSQGQGRLSKRRYARASRRILVPANNAFDRFHARVVELDVDTSRRGAAIQKPAMPASEVLLLAHIVAM